MLGRDVIIKFCLLQDFSLSYFYIGNIHKCLTIFVVKVDVTLMVSCAQEEIAPTVQNCYSEAKAQGT